MKEVLENCDDFLLPSQVETLRIDINSMRILETFGAQGEIRMFRVDRVPADARPSPMANALTQTLIRFLAVRAASCPSNACTHG
jgi:hypothetical protein